MVERAGLDYSSTCPWEQDISTSPLSPSSASSSSTIGQAVLIPTRIYIRQLLPAIRAGLLKGLSHITGGGFTENIPRMLPKDVGVSIDLENLRLPATFRWLMQTGGIAPEEMLRTFNCGIGMVAVVSKENVGEAMKVLQENGDAQVVEMGTVTDKAGVQYSGMEKWAKQGQVLVQ